MSEQEPYEEPENLPEVYHEPLIPREPLEDELHFQGGQTIAINRENCLIVDYSEEYEYMSHLYVNIMGNVGIRLFGINATPFYDCLKERGYDRFWGKYPDDQTITVWEDMMRREMERELEDGTGHELDED